TGRTWPLWLIAGLVALRLSIGWHLYIEGREKVQSFWDNDGWEDVEAVKSGVPPPKKAWASAAYLREASGPPGPLFRLQAGDLDAQALEILTPGTPTGDHLAGREPCRSLLPTTLDKAWDDYFNRFATHYKLTDEQRTQADAKLDQAKEK